MTQLNGAMQEQLEAKGLVAVKTQQQRIWEWLKDHPLSTATHAEAVFGKNASSLLHQMELRKMVFSIKERRQSKNHKSRIIKVYKVAQGMKNYEVLSLSDSVKEQKRQAQISRRKLQPGLNDVGTAHVTGHVLQLPVPPLAQAALEAAAAPAAPPAPSVADLQAQLQEVNDKLAAASGSAPEPGEPVPLTLANMTMDEKVNAIVDGLTIREGRMLLDRLKDLFG